MRKTAFMGITFLGTGTFAFDGLELELGEANS